jgi:hypothetical protein
VNFSGMTVIRAAMLSGIFFGTFATSLARAQDAAAPEAVSSMLSHESAPEPAKGGARKASPVATRNTTWTLGFTGANHRLLGPGGNDIVSQGGQASLGMGYLGQKAFIAGGFDFLMGPYGTVHQGQLDVDFFGNGATLCGGRTLWGTDLRGEAGRWGWLVMGSWASLTGQSIGMNHLETADPVKDAEHELVDNFAMTAQVFSAGGGLFLAWFDRPRPAGNSPSQLTNRIEGTLIKLVMTTPVQSSYSATYDNRSVVSRGRVDRPTYKTESVTSKGAVTGFSVLLGIDVFLGG